MPDDLADLMALDRVIHEPARLLLVSVLSGVHRADFTWLLQQTGLTRGNLSSHMSRLEEAGYVEVEKRFEDRKPRTLYHLTPDGQAALKGYRKRMRRLLG